MFGWGGKGRRGKGGDFLWVQVYGAVDKEVYCFWFSSVAGHIGINSVYSYAPYEIVNCCIAIHVLVPIVSIGTRHYLCTAL